MGVRAAVLTMAVLAFARVAATQSPPVGVAAPDATAVVRGRIVAADTGKPLRRARVSFFAPGLGGPPRTANTNADGRYEIKDLPAGQYTVTAARSGYLSLRYGQRRPLEAAKPLQILSGQTVERVDFVLPRTALIAGRVTDEIGDPVAGAQVFAMRSEFWMGRRQLVPVGAPARSDDSGQYRVFGLSPGTYVVRVNSRETWTVTRAGQKDVMSFVPTYAPGTPDLIHARQVTIGIAQQTDGVDISLVPGRTVTVSGTAVDSHGGPLMTVMLAQETFGPNGGAVGNAGNAAVAPDGTFTIRHVAPGEYRLQAAGSGEIARQPIVVTGTDIDSVVLIASAGWAATGIMTTENDAAPNFPRDQVRVNVNSLSAIAGMRMQGEPTYRPVLNDDWTFSITGIVGPARFQVRLPDGWMVKSILQNGREVIDAPLEMKSGETLADVQVVVTNRLTAVTGQLVDSTGAPIVDGTVIVFASDAEKWMPDSRFVQAARLDQQGQCQINGLPAGEYLAVALDEVQDGAWSDPDYLASIARYAEKLTLMDGESRTVSLKLVTPP